MQTVTLTAKLNIYPTDEQIQQLKKSMDAYARACDWISQKAFEIEIMMNAYDLHKKLYQDIRKNFGLKSQMAITAIRTVTAKYKAVNSQLKDSPMVWTDKETGTKFYCNRNVYWLQNPIRFKAPCLELQRTRDWCFKSNGTVSLNTLFGRIEVPYTSKGFEKYFTDEYTLGAGKVIKSNNRWYFYVSVTKKIAEPDHYNHVVGIDRGLNNIISVYDNDGYSENVSGSNIQRVRAKYQRVRASLQKKRTKGAKRTLRRVSGRENRYINDVNHCLTKTLVQKYGSNTLFVLEDLTEIRSSSNKKNAALNNELNSWAFYDLESKLKYKATRAGSTVINVDSAYTSQRCPICGNISDKARDRKKHLYTCKSCGYAENDDIIAAMNLEELGDRWLNGDFKPSFKN